VEAPPPPQPANPAHSTAAANVRPIFRIVFSPFLIVVMLLDEVADG